jgi:hypothetical protein
MPLSHRTPLDSHADSPSSSSGGSIEDDSHPEESRLEKDGSPHSDANEEDESAVDGMHSHAFSSISAWVQLVFLLMFG